jgi:hypothetical protein
MGGAKAKAVATPLLHRFTVSQPHNSKPLQLHNVRSTQGGIASLDTGKPWSRFARHRGVSLRSTQEGLASLDTGKTTTPLLHRFTASQPHNSKPLQLHNVRSIQGVSLHSTQGKPWLHNVSPSLLNSPPTHHFTSTSNHSPQTSRKLSNSREWNLSSTRDRPTGTKNQTRF